MTGPYLLQEPLGAGGVWVTLSVAHDLAEALAWQQGGEYGRGWPRRIVGRRAAP